MNCFMMLHRADSGKEVLVNMNLVATVIPKGTGSELKATASIFLTRLGSAWLSVLAVAETPDWIATRLRHMRTPQLP